MDPSDADPGSWDRKKVRVPSPCGGFFVIGRNIQSVIGLEAVGISGTVLNEICIISYPIAWDHYIFNKGRNGQGHRPSCQVNPSGTEIPSFTNLLIDQN